MTQEEAVFTYENIPIEYIKEIKVKGLTYKDICKYNKSKYDN